MRHGDEDSTSEIDQIKVIKPVKSILEEDIFVFLLHLIFCLGWPRGRKRKISENVLTRLWIAYTW